MEKRGGVLMLQEVEPKRLVGSIMTVVATSGEERITLTFFAEPGTLSISGEESRFELTMNRSVAFSLISLLRVAVAQVPVLRGPEGGNRPARSEHAEVVATAYKASVVLRCAATSAGVRRRDVQGQVELQLRGDVATAFENALTSALGTQAAGVADSST
jgi:hypothetical protein